MLVGNWTRVAAVTFLLALTASVRALPPGNLLRNASFQDDWITLLPETKNHHWCYSSEFYNRRDFNPDGWTCKGSWQWLNADGPAGQRRLLLRGPGSAISQRVNWVLVHDQKNIGTMADAGGFPQIKPVRSRTPERLVRDLTLRLRLSAKDVPANAAVLELALCPPGSITISDPLGTVTPRIVTASAPIPAGSYPARWLELSLPAARWLQATRSEAVKNPKEAAVLNKEGPVLPGTVLVSVKYSGKSGQIEVERAGLVESGPASPNLLPNGDFEEQSRGAHPSGWQKPAKYRHFPGRLYYLFNTWHNAAFPNRGLVRTDELIVQQGKRSLQMIVPAGDEVAVASEPMLLKQKEARLIEVHARVKTSRLAMLHLDALDETGERLDGFPFIHMAPQSIGTDDWRLIRQVFQPRRPIQSLRLLLCARGVNGYTLDDTGQQPQNNVVGTIWWDDVRLYEPESTKAELSARGVKIPQSPRPAAGVHLENLDLGECLLGDNVLTARVINPGAAKTFILNWEFTSPSGKKTAFRSSPRTISQAGSAEIRLPYAVTELCPTAYTEYRGTLSLVDDRQQVVGATEAWFGTWTVPIDLELGALYLRPAQKQLVRMNLGLSSVTMKQMASVRLDVVARGTGKPLRTWTIPADPRVIANQRQKLPKEMRDDLTNLLLTELDVSFLPIQPFHDPQRNWFVRVSALDKQGTTLATAASPPFCRQAHDTPQEPIRSVTIKKDLLFVNDRPWMPWGACYGHVPVYDGPVDSGNYLDLHNLPAWSMYDGFTAAPYTRKKNDFNCLRYVAGSMTVPKVLDEHWRKDNLYCSTAFAVPQPVFSIAEMLKAGKDKLAGNLAYYKSGPVVSVAPGIEETFGLFTGATPAELKGLGDVADHLRRAAGKPVMVGHGGYWNRLEFEKVPFFDIYDPETEPLYPANLHTDLTPLIAGKNKVIWLRPQMYEDVPYERWRFHTYVELMRGCRGWQFAHGPGDQSLFRGLHGEMEFWKPIVYSPEGGPKITIKPALEHWTRRYKGKTYLIVASTHALTLGKWAWHEEAASAPAGWRSRLTSSRSLFLHEANSYGADQKLEEGPAIHGIHHFPAARSWPAGSKLVQWVRTADKTVPANLVVVFKKDGRWVHAAAWGKFDAARWYKDAKRAAWFLHSFYRHSYGFLGWDLKLLEKGKQFMPASAVDLGKLPAAGEWVRLEVPLDKVGAAGGLLDGIAFAHEGGQVSWGRTAIAAPDGTENTIWGDAVEHSPVELAKTRIAVAGLEPGTRIRALFEDRELRSGDGFFTDDFRGQDLYQRYGGGYGVGYGDAPVALHLYEIEGE